MPIDAELSKAAKQAAQSFNLYTAQLRREGHKIRGDVDFATMSGISVAATALRDQYVSCQGELDRIAARGASQQPLPLDDIVAGAIIQHDRPRRRSVTNPLGLFLNHDYRRISDGSRWDFRFYDGETFLYTFWNHTDGGMRLTESVVREWFIEPECDDVEFAPAAEGIPIEDVFSHGDEARFLRLFVSEERFSELADANSALTLKLAKPTAVRIEKIDEVPYVIVAHLLAEGELPERIHAIPVIAKEKGAPKLEGDFTCKRTKWAMRGPEHTVVILKSTVEALLAKQGPVEQLGSLLERGIITSPVQLAPRSFVAVLDDLVLSDRIDSGVATTWFHNEGGVITSLELEFKRSVGSDGIELDGYEEATPEVSPEPESEPETEQVADAEQAKADAVRLAVIVWLKAQSDPFSQGEDAFTLVTVGPITFKYLRDLCGPAEEDGPYDDDRFVWPDYHLIVQADFESGFELEALVPNVTIEPLEPSDETSGECEGIAIPPGEPVIDSEDVTPEGAAFHWCYWSEPTPTIMIESLPGQADAYYATLEQFGGEIESMSTQEVAIWLAEKVLGVLGKDHSGDDEQGEN